MTSLVIAVLTYRRNEALEALLPQLVHQLTTVDADGRVLVLDNDPAQGARSVVEGFADDRVHYLAEPRPGIAAGRNRALESATEDVLVFIDDDERPSAQWLSALLATKDAYGVDAVVGPVVHEYERPLDPWIAAGGFFARPRPATGTPMQIAATNNLMLDMAVVRRFALRFDSEFGLSGGSDTLFTRQLSDTGATMVWCDEAPVLDPVPASRTTRDWARRRVFRLGNTWARVQVRTATTPLRRIRVRCTVAAGGTGRAGVGALRWFVGLLTRSMRYQAEGVRLIMRGCGMVAGAGGYVYMEYRRPPASSE